MVLSCYCKSSGGLAYAPVLMLEAWHYQLPVGGSLPVGLEKGVQFKNWNLSRHATGQLVQITVTTASGTPA
jgi:hypothetical protein